MAYDYLLAILLAGWGAPVNYLSAHVLFSIVSAFFLAGAIMGRFLIMEHQNL